MKHQNTLRESLGRLYPHVRPILPRLLLGLLCALGASVMALAIPQVLRILINDALADLAATGVKGVVIVPLGFVSDHMEVVWDLDTEAMETCAELGLVAERVPTPGTHAKFVAGLIDLVSERTADNTIIERPSTTDLGPWYDVCRPNCCANRRGEKPTIAGADSTVGLPETEQA